jgi:hypothetical protein
MIRLFCLCLISLTACSASKQMSSLPPRATYTPPGEVITQSLFEAVGGSISEENIQRILDGEIRLPDTLRIAVFSYSPSQQRKYAYYWVNEAYLRLQQQSLEAIMKPIEATGRTRWVRLMPTLLTGSAPDLTHLREAGVRMQADVMLIFQARSDTYYQYRLFKQNEVKAFATCEALLLDLRTGVIPFSAVQTAEQYQTKTDEDLNDDDFRSRVEQAALLDVLGSIGQAIVRESLSQ